MLRTFHPSPAFKGGRTYVHSTDLYPILLDTIDTHIPGLKVGAIKFTYRQLLTTRPDLFISDPGNNFGPPKNPATLCQLETQYGKIHAYFKATDQPISRNVDYDEASIDSAVKLDGKTIRISGEIRLTSIEVATSLGRRLHDGLAPQAPGLKWLLAKLELDRPFVENDATGLSITLTTRLGEHLTRSTIFVNKKPIGKIYFAPGRIPKIQP